MIGDTFEQVTFDGRSNVIVHGLLCAFRLYTFCLEGIFYLLCLFQD